jgi:hypothetical protein
VSACTVNTVYSTVSYMEEVRKPLTGVRIQFRLVDVMYNTRYRLNRPIPIFVQY